MNFLKTLFSMMVLNGLAIAMPVLAQNAPPGPVHFPAVTPVQTAPPTQVTPTPSPASAPITIPSGVAPATTPDTTVAGDIHDIRGPISIPYAWLWVIYLASGLALAVALYAFWKLLRRGPDAKPKLPFEIALDRLEAARSLMTPETVREYAFTVSEIIRGYIEQRFGEKAAHRTTEEFLSDLLKQTGTPLAEHRRRLEDFLNYCDLSKFARWQLSGSDMESMHESARVFVLDTHPQPEPPKATKAGAAVQPELIEAQ